MSFGLAAAIIVYENGEYFMKPIGVVTDSHSGISPEEAEQLGVKVLPMPFMWITGVVMRG